VAPHPNTRGLGKHRYQDKTELETWSVCMRTAAGRG